MKKRKESLTGETWKVKTECGNVFVTLNEQDETLYEINIQLGKSGNCQRGLLYLNSVQISKILQACETKDVKRFIKKHYLKFSCGCPFLHKGETYLSCIHWVGGKMLEKIKEEEKNEKT